MSERSDEKKMSVKRKKIIPPDGGFGWVVLASASLINFLIPGMVKSFGVLFVEFMQVFRASPTDASWMPALCYFLYSFLGPISSFLSVKYSYRVVTLMGGSFAATGMMLSYFANSVVFLYISYGVMFGIGAGLAYPPTIYIVTSYFDKKRGLANGLCVSGSAIGAIVLPPFLQYLLNQFGYRGAVLITGGCILNTLVCALMYHPVEFHMKSVNVKSVEGITNNNFNLEESGDEEETVKPSEDNNGKREETSMSFRPKIVEDHMKNAIYQQNVVLRRRRNTRNDSIVSEVGPISVNPKRNFPKFFSRLFKCSKRQSVDLEKPESDKKGDKHEYFDLSVLNDPIFLVILISNSTQAISNTNFMILLPTYAHSQGYDRDISALLVSVVSALDLVGRISGATLSDINLIPKYYYFVIGLFTSGLSLMLLPLAATYDMLAAFCALFGLASGTYIGITTVVFADLLGTERLKSSYGISLCVNGILQLVGPPVCGMLHGRVGSYKPIFFGCGFIAVLGAALWIFMPILVRQRDRREEQT